jgi:hypothetical protein
MSKARDLGNLLDTGGDVVSGSLDNVPTPSKTSIEALGIALPAANLTGSIANARIPAGAVTQHVSNPITKSTSEPTISTNPSGGVGTVWLRTTTGDMYCCTDATAGANVWTNIGSGTGSIAPVYDIDYLVIAGGGGGGNDVGGGGGAGGYRNSYSTELSGRSSSSEPSLTLTPGNQYTIDVGAGGADAFGDGYNPGSNGENSSIIGTGINVTSLGGGGGGSWSHSKAGTSGGSGGGGGGWSSYGAGASGTAAQGGDGGHGGTGTGHSGGGGGGAGGNGSGTGSNGGSIQAGGVGLSSSISGSAITRAVGGKGLPDTGTSYPGAANTGNGGDGNGDAGTGDGGSGVVILRMLTSEYSGTTSGYPTVTTSGSDTILTFNSDGSYTA